MKDYQESKVEVFLIQLQTIMNQMPMKAIRRLEIVMPKLEKMQQTIGKTSADQTTTQSHMIGTWNS